MTLDMTTEEAIKFLQYNPHKIKLVKILYATPRSASFIVIYER